MRDNTVTVDTTASPATLTFAEQFNVAVPLIDRHLDEGRGARPAIVGEFGAVSYAELADRVNRCGNALKGLGLAHGDRVAMMVRDCPEFFYLFWGRSRRVSCRCRSTRC